MAVAKNQTDQAAEAPDSLIEIVCQRGRYEEEMLERIKDAFDKNEQRKVFRLVGKLLYEGPGTVPLSPVTKRRSKGNDLKGRLADPSSTQVKSKQLAHLRASHVRD